MEPELHHLLWKTKIAFINQEYHATFLTRMRPNNPDLKPPMAVRKSRGYGIINFRKLGTKCNTIEKLNPIVGVVDSKLILKKSRNPSIFLPKNYFFSTSSDRLKELCDPKFHHKQATEVLLDELNSGELVIQKVPQDEYPHNYHTNTLIWTHMDSVLFQIKNIKAKLSRIPINYKFTYSMTIERWSELKKLGVLYYENSPVNKILKSIDF